MARWILNGDFCPGWSLYTPESRRAHVDGAGGALARVLQSTIDDIRRPPNTQHCRRAPHPDRRTGAPHTRTTGSTGGLRTSTERVVSRMPVRGLRSSVIPDAEAHVWRADGWNGPGQAGSSKRIWSTSVGGASTTRCSGGARAGWASGISVGSPRCRRTRAITAGSSIRAIDRMRPPPTVAVRPDCHAALPCHPYRGGGSGSSAQASLPWQGSGSEMAVAVRGGGVRAWGRGAGVLRTNFARRESSSRIPATEQ